MIHHILGGSNIAPLGWGQLCTLFGMAPEYDRDLEAPIEMSLVQRLLNCARGHRHSQRPALRGVYDTIAAIAAMLAGGEYVSAETYFTLVRPAGCS